MDFDLSKVMFITTANLLDPIPPPLRDRMEVLELTGYTEEEKLEIAFSHLLPRQLEAHGLTTEQMEVAPEAVRRVIASYTREAGLRNLEREIAALCRGVAREVAEGGRQQVEHPSADVAQYLGPPRFSGMRPWIIPRPGVATGLAWTPTGGDILFIEVLRMPGKGNLKLTGQLGDVMKESANAALSYIRARAPFLGIEEDFFEKADLHIHVPAGAIPKDGPSAGVAMLVRPGVAPVRRAVEKRSGHDRGDHPPGPCAARGRHQEQGPGRAPGRHPGDHPPGPKPGGPGGDPRIHPGQAHLPPGGAPGRGHGVRLPGKRTKLTGEGRAGRGR